MKRLRRIIITKRCANTRASFAAVSAIGIVFAGINVGFARDDIPLPPVRPPDLPAPNSTITAPVVAEPSPGDNEAIRAQLLESGRVVAGSLAPIIEQHGCAIVAPLRVQAIVLADRTKVILSPAVTMRASLASAFADWLREDLAPALSGDRPAKIEGMGAYECRSRNRIFGAKLSEHAKGNALDLAAIVTARGKIFAIAAPRNAQNAANEDFFARMKKTACMRFTTVLGPGSDPYHTLHLHLDLAERRSGAHLCQWTLSDPAVQETKPQSIR